ncbi:MFS transporter [Bombilactobacillus folatiphilus]|uniref:MFS transporter n=1 Tax=Bombilactobacillus folatiphilus TaxID=2923362 RepID=A0ABY4P8K5_9LACO|nr:MFS transporter [Bombilactobacillus folatiphilus]UQS81864.1 MFS transporter [Bombilactobacillus folatiphilus]
MKQIRLVPLLLVAFLNETAYSMMWPLATIYINTILHKSLTVAGTGLMFFSAANVLGAMLAGKLYDRFNQFYLTLFGMAACLVVCLLGIVFTRWPSYVFVLTAFGLTTGWLNTAVNVYGTLFPKMSTTKIFNLIYLVLNVGLVVGTMLISEIFKKSVVPIFVLAAAIYLFSFLTQFFCFPKQRLEYQTQPVSKHATTHHLPTHHIKHLFAVNFLTLVIVWTMYSQWESNFSVYLIDNGFALRVYSLLWALNGVIIIAVQWLLTWRPQIIQNLYHRIVIGLVFLSISYFVTIMSTNIIFIYLGMILLTIGEAIYVPTVPVIIDQWTPPADKGHSQGLVNGFSSVGRALGPLFGGLVIDHSSFKVLFVVAGCSMVLMTIWNYWNNRQLV